MSNSTFHFSTKLLAEDLSPRQTINSGLGCHLFILGEQQQFGTNHLNHLHLALLVVVCTRAYVDRFFLYAYQDLKKKVLGTFWGQPLLLGRISRVPEQPCWHYTNFAHIPPRNSHTSVTQASGNIQQHSPLSRRGSPI